MIRIYFKITKRSNNRSYICSEFVRDILENSNIVLPYRDTYISPDDVWTDERLIMTHRIL